MVIFDEAHNIEDVAREAASADLSVASLDAAASELAALALALESYIAAGVAARKGCRRGGWDEDSEKSPSLTLEGPGVGSGFGLIPGGNIPGSLDTGGDDDLLGEADPKAVGAWRAAGELGATVAALADWARAVSAAGSVATAGLGQQAASSSSSSEPSFSSSSASSFSASSFSASSASSSAAAAPFSAAGSGAFGSSRFEEEHWVFSGEEAIARLDGALAAAPGACALLPPLVRGTSSAGESGATAGPAAGASAGAARLAELLAAVLAVSSGELEGVDGSEGGGSSSVVLADAVSTPVRLTLTKLVSTLNLMVKAPYFLFIR